MLCTHYHIQISVGILFAALAKFQGKPVIMIIKEYAQIKFKIYGQATHIKVENCAVEMEVCATEFIPIKQKEKISNSPRSITKVTTTVQLADQSDKTFYFKFWIYNGDELVYSSKPLIKKRIVFSKYIYLRHL